MRKTLTSGKGWEPRRKTWWERNIPDEPFFFLLGYAIATVVGFTCGVLL